MKIVVDTNVLISSLFFGGKPRIIIELIYNKIIDAYVTNEIIEEYKDTVDYLKSKYKNIDVYIPLEEIVNCFYIIDSKSNVALCRDPDDDKFINCALDSKSLFVVSGDKDLLVLKRYKKIEIITVNEFLDRILEK